MKFRKLLLGLLMFSMLFGRASASAEIVKSQSISEKLSKVIDEASSLFKKFALEKKIIPSDKRMNEIINSIDTDLCNKYNVKSINLIKKQEIDKAYVDLVKKHYVGNDKICAAYIGQLLDEQNIKHYIINVWRYGFKAQGDNYEVVLIPGFGVIDFMGDFNQKKDKVTVRPLENFLKNTKNWGKESFIRGGYVNEYDEEGYLKNQKDLGVFMKENNITCEYKLPEFWQSLGFRVTDGKPIRTVLSRKKVERELEYSDCSDCKDLKDLAKHEKKGIYDILRDYLNINPRDFNFWGQHEEL